LLYDHADRRIQFFFMGGRYPSAEDIRAVHRVLQPVVAAAPGMTVKQMLDRELPVGKNKARVILGLLKEARMLASPEIEAKGLQALAERYRQRAQSDRDKLERMTFYAQSALCRWQTILEYFDAPAERAGCGTCDNCERMAREAATVPQVPVPPQPRAQVQVQVQVPFETGQPVRVRKYGLGAVEAIAGERVCVRFPNGAAREFLASYVRAAGKARVANA
jgi:ATP-dependent DNA helicase RecQ